ncbi:LysR substrate-binding domain-containing protein [Billgrantia endophytica]|uniref:LysR family transcriptional regulator n=1 Tax=Billgrantia endophytica TaxID=2033802 RepID=A0A2N7TXI1_9GAMM|nr:LysR substrate-binding domain-containing protein [Halomonas endophytica]PMR72886.1 LysR family transcriptional regulator [Halomonas endophytica]
MELRHLRYFLAVAETLNFTRAADKVHVTQSTLSHQIRQLEEELGQELFARVGKRVVTTEAGQTFYEQVVPILRKIDQAVGSLKEVPHDLRGELRIAATHSFNVQLIPLCLSVFIQRFPLIKVVVEELSGDRISEELINGNLDLGISYRPSVPRGLRFEPLYNEELKLITANDHPLADRKRVRMVELNGLRMTLLTTLFSTRQMLDECFAAAGARPQIVAELNAISPMIELVRRTDLCSIVADNALKDEPSVRIIPLENPTPVRTPGLLWAQQADRPAASRFMAETIRQLVMQGQAGADKTSRKHSPGISST